MVDDATTRMPPPAFGVIVVPVDVAHFDWLMFEAERHALFDAETSPDAEAWRQPVPVARKSWVVEAFEVKSDVEVAFPKSEFPAVSAVAKRLVEEAVVVKLFVVVALVEVELSAVKFWRVEEPFTRRFASVPRPLMNVVPKFAAVANIFVELAVEANELVVVADVPVALVKVKLPRIPALRLKLVEKRLVELAVVANERVVVDGDVVVVEVVGEVGIVGVMVLLAGLLVVGVVVGVGADSRVVVGAGSSAARAASGTDWAMSKRLSTAIPICLNIYVLG
jgi:hypothetical protein